MKADVYIHTRKLKKKKGESGYFQRTGAQERPRAEYGKYTFIKL